MCPGADPEGGGARGARPPLSAPNYLKSPLNWQKKNLGGEPPNSLRPSFFKSWIRPWCRLSYQYTRYIHPMLLQFWGTIYVTGPTLNWHWVNLILGLCPHQCLHVVRRHDLLTVAMCVQLPRNVAKSTTSKQYMNIGGLLSTNSVKLNSLDLLCFHQAI